MKKLFLIYIALFAISACASKQANLIADKKEQVVSELTQKYREQLEDCDKTADYDLEFGDLSTAGMDASVDKQINCYEHVAHQIIDRYYSEQSEKMKQRLDEYIKYSYKVSIDMYEPDSCIPACGTMITGIAYYKALQNTKIYMDDLFWAMDNPN
jgi:hypothetical protein